MAVLCIGELRFLERTKGAHALTLIHGDYHVLGNILFSPSNRSPRVIGATTHYCWLLSTIHRADAILTYVRAVVYFHSDWSELKPGLGPHDVAYMLISAPSDDRPGRDRMLLRRYWEGLAAVGVSGYTWDWCDWCVWLMHIARNDTEA